MVEAVFFCELSFYNIKYTWDMPSQIGYNDNFWGESEQLCKYRLRLPRLRSIKFKFHWGWDIVCIDYLCYVVALLRFYCMAKRKKLLVCVCVCGNWFGTKNGAQTLVGGFLQEIRAESRLICYCTSWQRTPIFVGRQSQDGGKVFPKLRFVYTKAIQWTTRLYLKSCGKSKLFLVEC